MPDLKNCTICGAPKIEKSFPFHKNLKKIGATIPGAGLEFEKSDSTEHFHYKCHSCDKDYFEANFDASTLLNSIKFNDKKNGERIQKKIKYIHKKDLDGLDLLTNYRTGMVRLTGNVLTEAMAKVGLRDLPLIVCVKYDNIRSCAIITIEKDKDGNEHYTIKDWVLPGI